MSQLQSTRKPHSDNLGYVAERKCKLGGHIVIYDRSAGFDCDADERWIVMHEPSSRHVAISSREHAYYAMRQVAECTDATQCEYDILPMGEPCYE